MRRTVELVCRAIRASGRYYWQILWQASVTTHNVIGCGTYQDKLYHLAR